MGLDSLLATLERRTSDTSDTSGNLGEVSGKPAPILGCTLDTPDTPQSGNPGNDARISNARDMATVFGRWTIHYSDRAPVEMGCSPEATRAQVQGWYPDAIAAEPVEPGVPMSVEEFEAWWATGEESVVARSDDQRSCAECVNLRGDGRCAAAARGELHGTVKAYYPVRDVLRRCERFKDVLLASAPTETRH
jgi:hypothetical protein